MAGRLAGKTALITAAGQGIGQRQRARDGARRRHGVRDRREGRAARRVSRRGERHTRSLDVLDDAAVRAAFDELPRARRPVQLRRLRAPRHDPRLHAEGLGLQLQPERARDVHRDPGRAAEDARQAREDRHVARRSSTWRRSRARSRACPTASSTARARPR